jgi:addiction module RelE/StbE family toxin
MWVILEHRSVAKEVRLSPKQVQKAYELWKTHVTHNGPAVLRTLSGYHDEALAGAWRGFRSSRLSKQYRVIYRVERDELLVVVERMTPHDYRR